jgi:hypothetical protein
LEALVITAWKLRQGRQRQKVNLCLLVEE